MSYPKFFFFFDVSYLPKQQVFLIMDILKFFKYKTFSNFDIHIINIKSDYDSEILIHSYEIWSLKGKKVFRIYL